MKTLAAIILLTLLLMIGKLAYEIELLRADCRTLAQQVADLQMTVKR